jgi:hypothetical protein
VTGDVNGDGTLDIVLTYYGLSTAEWWLGNGAGSFVKVGGAAAPSPQQPLLRDLDGNGRLDILVPARLQSWATEFMNGTAPPAGVAPFGSGTPGCTGKLGLGATSVPSVGNAAFGLTCTNAPANALGLALVTNAYGTAGNNTLGLGVVLYGDFLASTEVQGLDFFSDRDGYGVAPAPIPNVPALKGKTYAAQAIWLDAGCNPSIYGLTSSSAVAMTIQ